MLQRNKPEYRGLFPNWINANQEAQMGRAGIVFKSSVKVDDEYICKECADSGKADFLCALCDERKPTNKRNLMEIRQNFYVQIVMKLSQLKFGMKKLTSCMMRTDTTLSNLNASAPPPLQTPQDNQSQTPT